MYYLILLPRNDNHPCMTVIFVYSCNGISINNFILQMTYVRATRRFIESNSSPLSSVNWERPFLDIRANGMRSQHSVSPFSCTDLSFPLIQTPDKRDQQGNKCRLNGISQVLILQPVPSDRKNQTQIPLNNSPVVNPVTTVPQENNRANIFQRLADHNGLIYRIKGLEFIFKTMHS